MDGSWAADDDPQRLGAEADKRLRALAPKTPDDFREIWVMSLEDHRRRFGPTHTETLNAMDQLADYLAEQGQDRQAAALFEEVRRIEPERYESSLFWGPWFPLAVLKLRVGDREGFRALLGELLDRFGSTENPTIAEHISRLGTLIPQTVDPARLLVLGRRVVATNAERPWYLLARGAAEYRAGQYEAAARTVTAALSRQDYAAGRVQTKSLLAMGQARLGDLAAARRTLAEVDQALATAPTAIDQYGFRPGWHWREAAIATILHREAEGVLLDAAFPVDPFTR
jgi:tetratricopeptide (TPR) repeat protein